MKGNLTFAGILLLFLFALTIISSRPFLPPEWRQPAPTQSQPQP